MRRLTDWLISDFAYLPENERLAQRKVMMFSGLGASGLAILLTLLEMGLEWATPEGPRAFLRPVVFTLLVLCTTAMVMRASYTETAKFYLNKAALSQAFEHQARFDALTNLPNRRHFLDHLLLSLEGAAGARTSFALLMIDLDGFKDINDTFGHAVGDLLLQEVASRLQVALRPADLVARLGGDEFAVVLAEQPLESVIQVAARLVALLAQPLQLDGQLVQVSSSIGIARCPADGADGDLLMRRADLAMYAAKRTGGSYALYTPQLEPALLQATAA
jgi:diguanylate cyclase (GGDEF)-like protein